jgi:acyl-CoA reductase-like NAD-dependent aldehyde dehydrogenase
MNPVVLAVCAGSPLNLAAHATERRDAFLCGGQRCTALSCVIGTERLADELAKRIVSHVSRIQVGDCMLESTIQLYIRAIVCIGTGRISDISDRIH